MIMKFLQKHAALPAVLLSSCLSAADPLGIIGGKSATLDPAAFLVTPSGGLIPFTMGVTNGLIQSVAINDFGFGIIGGFLSGPVAYAALTTPSGGMPQPLATGIATGFISSVAINNMRMGLIGGTSTGNPPYAALVSPSGVVTPIVTGLPAGGFIDSVAINNSAEGIIGGQNATSNPYVALISPSGTPTSVTITMPSSVGFIRSVAINSSGQALIGGQDTGLSIGYAAFISPSGNVNVISPPIVPGNIESVAINTFGEGIIGGESAGDLLAYIGLISPTGTATPIIVSGPSSGAIRSVAINDSGYKIAGGFVTAPTVIPYIALISPAGDVTSIDTGLTEGVIRSVAINAFGQSLVVGRNLFTSSAYAAIISPSGVLTPLLASSLYADFLSVAILSRIPTGSLTGNNLEFANYINENAPQNAFYFGPAFFDGTLDAALESAAPTRNALSLYTAMNNLFYLNNTLSNHLRNVGHFQNRTPSNKPAEFALAPTVWKTEGLMASIASEEVVEKSPTPSQQNRPYTVWFEGIGALSYQKAQKQTVAFNPTTGAALFGFDVTLNPHSWVGGGAAYGYTQIHEKKNAGFSHIHQEHLFVYGSYQKCRFYFDGALWGGLFQIDQTRNIHMTGFEFKSTSSPHGGQLAPHVELGGSAYQNSFATIDPFAMLDWVAAWQDRYKEKGSGPFNAAQKHHFSSMLRTELGTRFYETLSFNTWRLTFQEKLSYVYKKPFRVGKMNTFLLGSPGTFTVETLTTPQNLGVVEFGMIFEPTDKRYPYGAITYQGEFGSASQSHQLSLEIDWSF